MQNGAWYYYSTMRHLLRGFTLTEIIIVVAIISLLASAGGLVAYQGSREKARDTQRLNDLERIALAAEAYRQEYGTYPGCNAGIQVEQGGISLDAVGTQTCPDGPAFLSYLTAMFGQIPQDPLGPSNNDFFYYYDGNHACLDSASGSTGAVMVYAVNTERQPSNVLQVCDSASGNDGGYLQTTSFGGTKNPSQPHVLILTRFY